MGVPLPIILMAAFMMISFGVAAFWVLKRNPNSFKQTIDPKPEQKQDQPKDSQQ